MEYHVKFYQPAERKKRGFDALPTEVQQKIKQFILNGQPYRQIVRYFESDTALHLSEQNLRRWARIGQINIQL